MEKTFTIPNISCGHCVRTIENELSELDGVQKVKADAEDKTVAVDWSSPLTEEDIRNLLSSINYPAE